MAPVLGKANTIEYIVPIIITLVKDEDADVRLRSVAMQRNGAWHTAPAGA